MPIARNDLALLFKHFINYLRFTFANNFDQFILKNFSARKFKKNFFLIFLSIYKKSYLKVL